MPCWLKSLNGVVALVAMTASMSALADRPGADDVFVCAETSVWTNNAGIESYFSSHYYEIDLRNSAFLDGNRQFERFAALPMGAEKIRIANMYHDQYLAMFTRLGLLLPHFSHPMDFAALTRQIEAGQIQHYPTDGNVQFLRVSLAQDMLDSDEAAADIILHYLNSLEELEARTENIEPESFTAEQGAEMDAVLASARQAHKDFRAIAKAVIFETDLQARMSARLIKFCGYEKPE